jgi:hypothetical protein
MRSSRSATALVGLVVLACATTQSRAEGVQRLDVVEVVRSGTDPADALPRDSASEGGVEGATLRMRPLDQPGALLENVPGLVVTQHSGAGKANQYFLRGFNLDHGTDFATFVDGVPVNLRTHAHGQGYTDLGFVIPELVSGIAYRKGPYDAEDGDFATAGSARFALVERLPGQIASATAGSFGYRRLLFAGSPATVAPGFTYGLEYTTADGPWTRPDDLQRVNGVLRYVRGDAANGFSVTGMVSDGRWNATDQIPRRAVASGALGRFDTLDPTDGGRTRRASLSAQWARTDAGGITRASIYGVASRFALFSNFTYFLDDPVNGDQFRQTDARTFGGFDVSRTFVSAWRGGTTETTLGLQSRADDIRAGLAKTVGRELLSTTRDDRVRETSVGVYAQNRTSWSPWLRTLAGLRLDQFEARVTSDREENGGRTRAALGSPKLGAVLGPWAKSELFLNWGRGFHSNDARGTTITVDPATGDPIGRTPLLVRSNGSEIGWRTAAIPNLVTSIALFRIDLDSELVFIGDAGTTEASRASRRTGIEWTGRYAPLAWLAFDWQLAMTRARFRDDDPAGSRIPGAPDRVIAGGIEVTQGRSTAALRLRHFGRRPLIEDGSVQSEASTLLSARVRHAVNRTLALQLEGFNLANRRSSQIDYFYVSRLRGEASAVEDVHFHPTEPRTVRVAVIASF